jgi:hypothetical protein
MSSMTMIKRQVKELIKIYSDAGDYTVDLSQVRCVQFRDRLIRIHFVDAVHPLEVEYTWLSVMEEIE